MSGLKKEYSFKINGLAKEIQNVTTLDEALKKLDATIGSNTTTIEVAARTSRQRASAMTEEEKAEKKLAETIDKVVRARTDANRAQIDANQAAREAQRQAVLEQQAINASANSVEGMRAKLALLKHEWKGLDTGSDKFREMTAEINALNDKIKEAEQSTGDFRRNVGNYSSALSGLEDLSAGIDSASKSSMGLAQSMLATNQFMAMFGSQSEDSTEQAKQLQKILALLAIVQGVNNNLLKSGIVQCKGAAIMEGLHAMQVRARAAAMANANKQTIAGTIAQKAFNLVAKANPYVLLAAALLTVVGAVVAYKVSADDATESTKRYKSAMDGMVFSTKDARDAHDGLIRKIRDIQVEIDLANGKLTDYQANLLRISNRGADAADEVRKKYADLREEIEKEYKPAFYNTNPFTGEATGYFHEQNEKEKTQKLTVLAEEEKAELLKVDEETNKDRERENARTNAAILAQNEDLNNANLGGFKATLAQIETDRRRDIQKAIEDNKTIAENNKDRADNEKYALKDISAINAKYDNQKAAAVKDAGKKAADASKAALTKTKASLEKELRLLRQAEDDKTALIADEYDRRREESRYKYERQREDLEKQLKEDKDLTAEGQNAIRAIIANIIAHWEAEDKETHDAEIKDRLEKEKKAEADRKELLDKRITDADRRNSLLLNKLDLALEEAQQKIGEVVVRNKGGLELIDVEATRANLAATNKALDEYIEGVKKAQKALKESHEATLKDLKEGTAEYEEELQKYAAANLQLNADLAAANKERETNTKASNQTLTDFYMDLFEKIGKYAQAASMAITSVTDTLTMGLEMQIESLNEQLEEVTERYDEVVKLREQSTERVEDLEERLRAATGGTAEALKEQLQSEMHARGELEREEARLQKEKEKREAEIKKKEKQAKRLGMVANIAQSIANTAMGVTQALAAIPPPFNFALAALVGAMGAAQVGIMAKQLTKMEDGGLISGPSHAQGGARIHGTNIEVEGGEYVVNKKSTAANARLVEFINDKRGTITAADLVGVVPGEVGTPLVVNNLSSNEDRIIDAIESIDFSPKVAVTDIIDATDTVTNVRDLAGY